MKFQYLKFQAWFCGSKIRKIRTSNDLRTTLWFSRPGQLSLRERIESFPAEVNFLLVCFRAKICSKLRSVSEPTGPDLLSRERLKLKSINFSPNGEIFILTSQNDTEWLSVLKDRNFRFADFSNSKYFAKIREKLRAKTDCSTEQSRFFWAYAQIDSVFRRKAEWKPASRIFFVIMRSFLQKLTQGISRINDPHKRIYSRK